MLYAVEVAKAATTRATSVCLLSSHAFFLTQFESLLSLAGHRPKLCRLQNVQLEELSPPKASVFVFDGAGQPHESVVAGVLKRSPESQVIVISENFSDESAFTLLGLGVKGLLTYAEANTQLPPAVEAVGRGGYWVPRNLLSRFVDSILKNPGPTKRMPQLRRISPREQQILDGLLNNRSNKEIANDLNISERTVKFHVSNLLSKYGVQRRADLIVLAFQKSNAAVPAIQ